MSLAEEINPFACKRSRVIFQQPLIRQTFEVFTRYIIDEKEEGLGKGSYGYVCGATDRRTGERVAIKKLVNVFDEGRTKSCLREIKLLSHFSHRSHTESGHHENILRLRDIMIPIGNLGESTATIPHRISLFDTVYIVTDCYENSLRQVIDGCELPYWYRANYLCQILKGVKAIHSAGCIHRDLKPENILVTISDSFQLCICDFGSGRDFNPDNPDALTDGNLVTSLWYRAPEVLLGGDIPDEQAQMVDIWSIGCIAAEMVTSAPLFQVSSSTPVAQLNKIQKFTNPGSAGGSLGELLLQKPDVPEHEIDVITKMLRCAPADRISIESALSHEHFQEFSSEVQDMPPSPTVGRFTYDVSSGKERQAIWAESLSYNPEVKEYLLKHDLPLEVPDEEEK